MSEFLSASIHSADSGWRGRRTSSRSALLLEANQLHVLSEGPDRIKNARDQK